MNPNEAIDIRTPYQIRGGWWVEPKSRVACIFTKDGLLCAFRRSDVEALMDRKYPFQIKHGRKIWYFNDTLDREIAEMDMMKGSDDQVVCNPQVYWQHYQEK